MIDRNIYGTIETNGLESGDRQAEPTMTVEWTDPDLARITRLRLLSDPGFPMWDVSYCHGELKDGTEVWVSLPFDQLRRSRRDPVGYIMAQIYEYGRRDHVFVKGLGISPLTISTLQ